VLVRNIYLSLDPYMRGRMNESKSYAASAALNEVMVGETAGEVVESKSPKFKPGDTVLGYLGWQGFAATDARNLRTVDPKIVPLSNYLGVAGMPGVTAWYGLLEIGRPKEGETVAVSAASGAVGSVVGQLAKIKGCRAVGIAGGPQKCDYVVKELGFDACVDHRANEGAGDLTRALAKAAPGGIDVYFENVGGPVLDAALMVCNPFARIPVCGMIADYNASERYGVKNMITTVFKRLKLQGFIVSDHLERWPEAISQLAQWVREGKIKYRESVTQGLENAPKAFIGLFKGENFGKQLIKID
jgi:NADPH-dependent curcumin reductase CurA